VQGKTVYFCGKQKFFNNKEGIMLEILFLIFLAKKIGKIVEEKGRKPGRYKAMLVAFWFGGEIIGFIIGGAMLGESIGMYLIALIGAGVGAAVSFGIANNLSPEGPESQTQARTGVDLKE
jgi:hypothetical protein